MMIDDIKLYPAYRDSTVGYITASRRAFGTGSNGMDNAPPFFRCVKPKRDELGRIF
jgi:hypothetical protein